MIGTSKRSKRRFWLFRKSAMELFGYKEGELLGRSPKIFFPGGLIKAEVHNTIRLGNANEAMTSKRSYKKVQTKEAAIKELELCAGTQFDPVIVRVFIDKVLMSMEPSMEEPVATMESLE